MKIIFDNEEQKESFFEHIAADYCPSIFGYTDSDCEISDDCSVCWKYCGIKMEVNDAN